MKFFVMIGSTILSIAALSCGGSGRTAITQDDLMRRTQEMMDAVAAGDKTPWQKYVAEDALCFDEKGRNMNKAALIADIEPLPQGYSGTIKVGKARGLFFSDTAILSYDLNETEIVFGQNMNARYHGTDTWRLRDGQWQIVASQMLRYYEDPVPGRADKTKYRDYVGTYEVAPGKTIVVSTEGNDLYSKRGEKAKDLLIPEAADIFFRKGVEGRRLFRRAADGRVDALIDRRNNEDIVWRRVK